MAKRKLYDAADYKEKTAQLETIFHSCTPLDLSDPAYQRFGEPGEQITVVYIDATEMPRFKELADFDCRRIKLVNYNRPAIHLSFFQKHKYFVDKKPTIVEVKGELMAYLDKLLEQYDPTDVSEANQLLAKQIAHYQQILKRIGSHQFAFSNYTRNYVYAYVTYRYFVPTARQSGAVDSANTHLIKHTTNREGTITTERTNVIFVDPQTMRRRVSYDNKQVDSFLESFPEVINCGKYDLYIK